MAKSFIYDEYYLSSLNHYRNLVVKTALQETIMSQDSRCFFKPLGVRNKNKNRKEKKNYNYTRFVKFLENVIDENKPGMAP